ncbi:MAG: ligand-binding receptor, partial [Alphaproteobacteria bacterium]
GTIDAGLGAPLTLSPENHQASRGVWPMVIDGGAFQPLDWSIIP